LGAGILILAIPFFIISKWILIAQGIIAIKLFVISGKMFSAWGNKKKEIDILTKRNQNEFRPDTFEIFMQAPCGRLVTRQVLKDLNKQNEYKNLLKFRKPLLEVMRENCVTPDAKIYINEEAI
jgi:hypothetical protein